MMAYLPLILFVVFVISAFVLLHYAKDSENPFIFFFSFFWSVICVCLVVFVIGVPLVSTAINSNYLKDKYETVTRMIEVYDEKDTPYDIGLIEEVAKWNTTYDKYVKHMNGPFGILYPDKLIEGTEKITLIDKVEE